MRPLPSLLLISSLLLVACGDREESRVFTNNPEQPGVTVQSEVDAEIKELAKGKDPDDAKASAAYDLARLRLERRGSTIEMSLIDALRTGDDWGVRLGCIEVLQSVGTRQCIEHLIAALQDDQPLVSFQAEMTLRVLTDHRELPEAGKPTGPNGLPPLPVRAATDLGMDAETRIWTTWHAAHHQALYDAWTAWWATAKKDTVIK